LTTASKSSAYYENKIKINRKQQHETDGGRKAETLPLYVLILESI